MRTIAVGTVGLSLFLAAILASGGVGAAVKDQSRIGGAEPTEKPDVLGPKLSPGLDLDGTDPDSEPHTGDENEFSQDIEPIETIDLTDEMARKALDALVDIRVKYEGAGLFEYETLEAFVQQTAAGKRMREDLVSYGFATVKQWDSAILSIDFAYGAILDGEENDIKAQIEEVRGDTALSEDDRKAMIDGLTAMLSTPGNMDIVRMLMKDATYAEKLKQLDEME